MKVLSKLILFTILLCWKNFYSQSGGSDIIICLDNSASISGTAFSEMTQSTKNIIQSVLGCNTKNRVSVVHYGTHVLNPTTPTTGIDVPRIYIESDFTENIATAQNFTRRLDNGDHFHEAVGLMGNALDNIPNVNIVSPQKTLSTNPSRPLIIFLFSDAAREGGDISGGSFLIKFNTTATPLGSNDAFAQFTNFKNNRNAKFVIVHVNSTPANIATAAGIASLGGSYMGPYIESYTDDPNYGLFPRSYLNKTNFVLTSAEIASVSNNICTIGSGNIEFYLESINCEHIFYPINIGGTYSIPPGTSISIFQISLVDIATGIAYPIVTPVTYPSANTFNFSINQVSLSNPLSGNYDFLITLVYTNGTTSQTILARNSITGQPYDIEFCCPTDLNITTDIPSSNIDSQAAENSITASNIINYGSSAIYHAGSFVSLKASPAGTGFHAKEGSNFHAFIEGCSVPVPNNAKKINDYEYIFDANADPNNIKSNSKTIDRQKYIYISPNPNNGLFKVSLNNIKSGLIQILDMNGKIVFEKSFENEKEIDVNIQKLPSATYIVKTISGNEIFTEKVIKK